jgi:hypothetical protein
MASLQHDAVPRCRKHHSTSSCLVFVHCKIAKGKIAGGAMATADGRTAQAMRRGWQYCLDPREHRPECLWDAYSDVGSDCALPRLSTEPSELPNVGGGKSSQASFETVRSRRCQHRLNCSRIALEAAERADDPDVRKLLLKTAREWMQGAAALWASSRERSAAADIRGRRRSFRR